MKALNMLYDFSALLLHYRRCAWWMLNVLSLMKNSEFATKNSEKSELDIFQQFSNLSDNDLASAISLVINIDHSKCLHHWNSLDELYNLITSHNYHMWWFHVCDFDETSGRSPRSRESVCLSNWDVCLCKWSVYLMSIKKKHSLIQRHWFFWSQIRI